MAAESMKILAATHPEVLRRTGKTGLDNGINYRLNPFSSLAFSLVVLVDRDPKDWIINYNRLGWSMLLLPL
ncbi:MAG: hypothetical protein MK279_10240 [Gemmatimonadetes bacterium]|nr:hypothetical protein [Gemmatimonadota bacterium]